MTSERRFLWLAVGVVVAVAMGLFLVPRLREELAPEPSSALVAVEVEGSGVAEVGRVDVESGQRFTLRAVLVAHDRQGEPFYYSEAPALRIDGRPVPADRLRAWDRGGEIAVLWFTVEGYRPFMRLEDAGELEGFRFEESFRPDWGRGWTIAGSVGPRNNALARGFESGQDAPFGTARYHVRIEKYFRAGDPAPLERYRSPGAAAVFAGAAGPTLVRSLLPDGLGRASAVFGTPQLEPVSTASPELLRQLTSWYEEGLAFSRPLLFGGLLEDRGMTWSQLEWAPVDLEESPRWGAIGSGDLLRSGERIVVLFRDAGVAGSSTTTTCASIMPRARRCAAWERSIPVAAFWSGPISKPTTHRLRTNRPIARRNEPDRYSDPGDGIGPEVVSATLRLLEAVAADIEWERHDAGMAALERHGDPLPAVLLESIERNGIALKGPVTTPVGKGFRSVNVQLRKHFDLYANLRPVFSLEGIPSRYEGVDLVVVRENTEGLYSGLEHQVVPGVVESLKIITEKASTRIARFALDFARRHGRSRVTAVHKANIMKMADGLFLDCFYEVAKEYPDIDADDRIIDNMCMQLVVRPEAYDVLLLENLYGDIVSDLAAGLVGGLGVVPGANIGERIAVFEAVHGSAPDIAGRNLANPTALMRSALMMLRHLDMDEEADRAWEALKAVIVEGEVRTGDIGGSASTTEFTEAVLGRLP